MFSLQDGLPWQLVTIAITLTLTWGGVLFGLLRWALERQVRHFDNRFTMLESTLTAHQQTQNALQIGLAQLQAEVAREYVRREDWIRMVTVNDAKLDRLHELLMKVREESCQTWKNSSGKMDAGES